MARPSQKSVLRHHRKRAAGSTIEPKIHTCHFEGESERCSASGECEVSRNSPPRTLLFSIASIRTATSSLATHSKPIEPPLSLSGGNFVPARFLVPGASRDEFEFVLTAPRQHVLARQYTRHTLSPVLQNERPCRRRLHFARRGPLGSSRQRGRRC